MGIRRTVASCPQWPPSLSYYTAKTWNRLLSNASVKCITVLLQIKEVPCSKLDQDTGCQKRTLSCLPTVPPAKCRGPCRVILSASLNKSHVNKVIINFSKGQRKHDVWPPLGIQRGQETAHGQTYDTMNMSPLQKLIFPELVKFFACYGTRRFITVITTAWNLHLSWARLIRCMSSYHVSLSDFITQVSHWTVSTDTVQYITKFIMGSDIWLPRQVLISGFLDRFQRFVTIHSENWLWRWRQQAPPQGWSAPARLHYEMGLNSWTWLWIVDLLTWNLCLIGKRDVCCCRAVNCSAVKSAICEIQLWRQLISPKMCLKLVTR